MSFVICRLLKRSVRTQAQSSPCNDTSQKRVKPLRHSKCSDLLASSASIFLLTAVQSPLLFACIMRSLKDGAHAENNKDESNNRARIFSSSNRSIIQSLHRLDDSRRKKVATVRQEFSYSDSLFIQSESRRNQFQHAAALHHHEPLLADASWRSCPAR